MVENIKDHEKYVYFSGGRYMSRSGYADLFKKDKITDLINIMENILDDAPVDLKLAKELKQLGFNKKTNFYYVDCNEVPYIKTDLYSLKNNKVLNHNKYDDFIYSAPTNKIAQKWLIKNRKPQIS